MLKISPNLKKHIFLVDSNHHHQILKASEQQTRNLTHSDRRRKCLKQSIHKTLQMGITFFGPVQRERTKPFRWSSQLLVSYCICLKLKKNLTVNPTVLSFVTKTGLCNTISNVRRENLSHSCWTLFLVVRFWDIL